MDDERDAARALYVALTRARDRLILALPAEPGTAKDRPQRMVDLLRERAGFRARRGRIDGLWRGAAVPVFRTKAATERSRTRSRPAANPLAPLRSAGAGTCHAAHAMAPEPLLTPAAKYRRSCPRLEHFRLGPKLGPGMGTHETATERGSAWHLAFRTLAVALTCGPACLQRPVSTPLYWMPSPHRRRSHPPTGSKGKANPELPLQSPNCSRWRPDGSETNVPIRRLPGPRVLTAS